MATAEEYDIKIDPLKAKKNKKHGINMIALTDDPAIEVKGFFFNKEALDKRKVLNDDQKAEAYEYLKQCGVERQEQWKEVTVDEYLTGEGQDLGKFAEWQLDSSLDRFSPDGKGVYMVRYRYDVPKGSGEERIKDTSRSFCREVIGLNRIYTYEEISQQLNNPEFGNYSIFDYKGSYGCRHVWIREYYFADFDDDQIRKTGANPISRQSASSVDEMATTVNAKLSSDTYKMRVAAPALIPDKKIPRIDPDSGDVFTVQFSTEQIDKMWSNFQSKNVDSKFNIDHTDREAPAYLLEGWIIETEEDKAYSKYRFDKDEVPIGSLIVVSQFTDFDFFMEEIVEKEQYGYSVEGFFDIDLKMKAMAEETKENKEETQEVQKFELDGKFYKADENGKLVELMEEKTEEKEEERRDEVREKMEEEKPQEEEKKEEMVEETEEEKKYYTKEELDEKLETIVEMIAKLEGGREEEKEEVVEEKEDFKKKEIAEQKEDNQSFGAKFRALAKLKKK